MKMAESSPKRIVSTVGKGEIIRYEQFLILPLCFQKTHKNKGLTLNLTLNQMRNFETSPI